MARPCKERNTTHKQKYICFKPSQVDIKDLEKIELQLDEIEAIKLADLEWLSMKDGSEKMWISASTFCRLTKKARNKLADFIINWKRIRVYK